MSKLKKKYIAYGVHPEEAFALAMLEEVTGEMTLFNPKLLHDSGFSYFKLNKEGFVVEINNSIYHGGTYVIIHSIPIVLSELKYLEKLVLHNYNIYEIPSWFSRFKFLKELDFSTNNLEEIPKYIKNFDSLKKLNLMNNRIKEIPEELFTLTALELLNLSSNEIREIPKQIVNLSSLKVLDISHNNITKVPIVLLPFLNSIESLNLIKGNKIKSYYREMTELNIPEIISKDPRASERIKDALIIFQLINPLKIKKLVIGDAFGIEAIKDSKELESIKNIIKKMKNLEYLDLKWSHLNVIPEFIFELKNLKGLNIQGNQIKSLQDSIIKLQSLETLIFDGDLPISEKIQNLNSLNNLDIQYRFKKELPHSIVLLEKFNLLNKIKRLYFYECDIDSFIEQLEPIISKLSDLESLSFGHCNLTNVPDFVFRLKNIKILEFQWNNIEAIPKKIKNLKNLERLRFFNEKKIKEIPDEMRYFHNLKHLDLYGNNIEKIPEILKDFKKLEYLGLAQNKIDRIPEWIGELTSLKKLRLEKNLFEEVPKSIIKLSKLEFINLDSKKLQTDRFPQEVRVFLDTFKKDIQGYSRKVL